MSHKTPKKRNWKVDSPADFCPLRKPLANRLPWGNPIVLHEGTAPAVSVDECRSWAGRQAWLDEDYGHPQPAPGHPNRRAAPGLVKRAVVLSN